MTEHVALVHDGRVLVDETGALPSFDRDEDSPGAALRLVGGDIAVAPAAKLPDGRRVHFVATRGAAPCGRNMSPSSLGDLALATVVEQAVLELDPVRTPPGRPNWFRPGWFERVETWIDSVLATSGRRRTQPIATP